jgi:hypothetical protein
MSTEHVGDTLANRWEQLKQQKREVSDAARVFVPAESQPIIIKPGTSSWEELETKLDKVVNLPGLWLTVRKLYEAGQGAELETAAEIALAKAKKSRFNMFAAMVSKKSGNWETRTLKMVHETWAVRRNALEVIDKLKLSHDSTKAILALAWRLKNSIVRYLGMATEQGQGIKNPAGLFFALTKKVQPAVI